MQCMRMHIGLHMHWMVLCGMRMHVSVTSPMKSEI
jgi:hypothetical protein